jgi:diguanylate cyclase (GGDEF)-like protein
VPTESSQPGDVLLGSALLLARSADLPSRLHGLAAAAVQALDGRGAIIYLLDPDTGSLQPVAGSGVEPAEMEPLDAVDEGATDASVIAARERHAQVVLSGADAELTSALLQRETGLTAAIHVPLVVTTAMGSPEVEGVLAVGVEHGVPASHGRELLEAVAALAAVAAHESRLEIALTERSDWFDRLAHTDALTGLANRRTLDRVLELELARAARQPSELCVAMFVVDRHGAIAAAHGAHVADDVLRRVASTIAQTVRLVDTVARFGHDEFVVVAPGSAGLTMARRVAEAVAALEALDGDEPISVSVGVARFPGDGRTAEELLSSAEGALRQAATKGSGTVESANEA